MENFYGKGEQSHNVAPESLHKRQQSAFLFSYGGMQQRAPAGGSRLRPISGEQHAIIGKVRHESAKHIPAPAKKRRRSSYPAGTARAAGLKGPGSRRAAPPVARRLRPSRP